MNDSQFNSTDRLRGLLILAAQPQLEMTTCPSNIQLLKFMEGQLSVDAEEQLLRHFQACPECYRKWQEVASEVAVHEHEFEPRSSRLTSLYHRLQLFLRESPRRLLEWFTFKQVAWVAIPALALVVTWHVLLTPTVPPTPSSDLLQQLNESILVVRTIQPLQWSASKE